MNTRFIISKKLIDHSEFNVNLASEEEHKEDDGLAVIVITLKKDDTFNAELIGDCISAENIDSIRFYIWGKLLEIHFCTDEYDSRVIAKYNANNVKIDHEYHTVKITVLTGESIEFSN